MNITQVDTNEKLIILAGTLIDGTGEEPQDSQAIIIEDQLIQNIIPQNRLNNYPNINEYQQIDLNDLTILPGLIDSHVHLALDGIDFKKTTEEWDSPAKVQSRIEKELANTLNHGIVAIRDGGDKAKIGLESKKKVNQNEIAGPQIIATGQAAYKKGNYGSFLGPGINCRKGIQSEISRLTQLDIDQLKVLVSGIVSFSDYGKVGDVQFTNKELKYIVDLTHHLGLEVMAHSSSNEAVEVSIEAGVDTLEHGYFLSEESLKRLAEKEIPWIPTVVPVANQLKVPQDYSEDGLDVIKRTYELQLEMIDKAAELGVKLGIGTDAGAYQVRHGLSYYRELELFNQTSLSPLEIIKAATYNNAEIIELNDELGSIEIGKRASLIGVKDNPLENLSTLKKPERVIYSPNNQQVKNEELHA
ncbi:amidohydrolase family protein [Selenihalanaerobacter shriftii]|uniref:Imidazolonepropionase n=1 Tax=Selenihalanaerobacter shriftii TaxID=142842 RepID=A0A1T4JQX5_9FIRM|nr:amidohydrolase family protein [Selenihalanaerobacter shriftii]SJZ32549.1 Imidazolonepropionase [Selenihalanaerobacter shriftii]